MRVREVRRGREVKGREGIGECGREGIIVHFLFSAVPAVSAPTNWTKGKLLGSGAFGQVSHIDNYTLTCKL